MSFNVIVNAPQYYGMIFVFVRVTNLMNADSTLELTIPYGIFDQIVPRIDGPGWTLLKNTRFYDYSVEWMGLSVDNPNYLYPYFYLNLD